MQALIVSAHRRTKLRSYGWPIASARSIVFSNTLRPLSILVLFFCAFCIPVHAENQPNQISVTLPTLSDFEPRQHNKPCDDEEHQYSMRWRGLHERRAENLLAAGHYSEAIPDFLIGIEETKGHGQSQNAAEFYCGLAYEKSGNFEAALQHYENAGLWYGGRHKGRLLIKLGRYSQAKEYCDKGATAELESEAKRCRYQPQGCDWLRLRAAANDGLANDEAAIADLTEAAKTYLRDNSELAQVCIDDANYLNKKKHLEKSLEIQTADLPSEGKERVLNVIKYLISSSDPYSIDKLNALIGANIRIPGPHWVDIDQDHNVPAGFYDYEYRAGSGGPRVDLTIATNKCCITKQEVLALIPASFQRGPGVDWFNGYARKEAESWRTPAGILQLSFGHSRLQVLEKIELSKGEPSKDTSDWGWPAGIKAAEKGDYAKAIELYTEGLKSNPYSGLYLARARALVAIGKYDQAVADLQIADAPVSGQLRWYLCDVSETADPIALNHDQAVALNKYLCANPGGRECWFLWLSLAHAYLQQGRDSEALSAANHALAPFEKKPIALYAKAKAEYGLHRYKEAIRDGRLASDQFFDQARIVRRDEVNAWLERIPAR